MPCTGYALLHAFKAQKLTGTMEYLVAHSMKKVLATKAMEKRRDLLEDLNEKLIPFTDSKQIREWVSQKVKEYG
ncbi:MAG: hypothetical protein IPJ40_02755 [Saprospirales bacterium]|nr:hypothetical protein [Saprospirales bacterium]